MLFRSLIALLISVHGLLGSSDTVDLPEATRAYDLDLSSWIIFNNQVADLTGEWETDNVAFEFIPVIPGSNFLHAQQSGKLAPAFQLSSSEHTYLIIADQATESGILPEFYRYTFQEEGSLHLEYLKMDIEAQAFTSISALTQWIEIEGKRSLSVIQTFELSRSLN